MILKLKHILIIVFAFLACLSNLVAKDYFVQLKKAETITTSMLQIKEVTQRTFTYHKAFRTIQSMGLNRVYVISFDESLSTNEFNTIQLIPNIELIEEVPQYSFFYTPNDYNATIMWNLEKISSRQAWDIEKGGKNILVALVDDGMDTAHSDLQPTIWKNTNEIPGNGIDDDNNGYIDDVFGWDMADNDNNPHVLPSHNLSHGTHCSGTIGARTDNNNGISGIGFNVKIMPIKCGRNGTPFIYNAYQGVEYAIENGARIISMSWGGGSYSYIYQLIFDVAAQKNVVCVAAAGNSSTNTKMYPAAYNHVIAVGSTTTTDAKSGFSNYGTWVDVMAPGSNIYSTIPGNAYGYKSGTSMACPLVSGLCALMLSRNPNLTAAQVESCLKSSCDNINSSNSSFIGQIGAGRINAYEALRCIKPLNANFATSKQVLCISDTVRYVDKTIPLPNSWYWEFEGGTPATSTIQNPYVRYNTTGVFKTKLTVVRGGDTDVIEKLNYMTVGNLTATFSGNQTINKGEYATIRVDFSGLPPWTLIYQDEYKKDTIANILQTPYFILKTPDSSFVYKPISVSSFECSGSVKDSTKIIVTNIVGISSCDSSLRFHATFGGSGDDQLNYVNVINDSIIYVVGKTNSSGLGHYDAYVAKLNINGNVIWSKTIGGTLEDAFFALRVDKFENLYCAGFTHSNVTNRSTFMAKIDKNGNLKWKKYFDGGIHEYLYNLTLSKNEDFIIFVGHCNYNGYGSSDNCIYKIDTSGNVDWVKQLGTAAQERSYAATCDNSDNIYVAGFVYPNTVPEGSIIKMTKTGNVDYYKKYIISNNNFNSEFVNIEIHNNRNLYILGRHINNGIIHNILMKTNLTGNVIWSKLFNMGGSQSNPNLKIINNQIYVVDRVAFSGKTNGSIFKFDTLGNILESKIISHPTNNLIVNHMDFNSQIEAIYVGFQNIGNNQFLIGKTNCKLNNSCLMSNRTPTISNSNYNSFDFIYSIQNKTKQATTSHSLTNFNISSINYTCKSTNIAPIKKICKLKTEFSYNSACQGDSSYFKSSAIDSNEFNIENWYWDFGDSSSLSGIQNPKKKFMQKGHFNVTLITTSSNGSNTCADTISKLIQINDSLTIVTMPKDTLICLGDSIQVDAPFMNCGLLPYKYLWTPSFGINNNKISNPFFAPKQTTTYTLLVTDENGNSSKDSFTIFVRLDCCKSIARFETDKENICKGDTIKVLNTSSFDASSAMFNWVINGAQISSFSGKTPPPLIFNGSNASIKLQLSDVCSNDTQVNTYFVYSASPIDIQNTYQICGLDTLQLGESAFGRNSYEWSPNIGLNNNRASDPLAVVNTDFQYFLKVVNEYGCKSYDTVNIENYAIPDFSLGNDTGICLNESINLNAPLIGQRLWSTGSNSPNIVVHTPNQYWLKLSNQYCSKSDTIQIDVYDLPVINTQKNHVICNTGSVQLGNSPVSNHVYEWTPINWFKQCLDCKSNCNH
jgi:PKD repeat protein